MPPQLPLAIDQQSFGLLRPLSVLFQDSLPIPSGLSLYLLPGALIHLIINFYLTYLNATFQLVFSSQLVFSRDFIFQFILTVLPVPSEQFNVH